MIFDNKQLPFVHKIIFPKMMLFGEKGEAFLKNFDTKHGYLFISEAFYKAHRNNDWIEGEFKRKVVRSSEPTGEDVILFNKEIKKVNPDFVVAIGGGSVIDLAKLSRGNENVTFIVLPTTIGSGAEVSQHAVFTENGVKKSSSSFAYLPDLVIINPKYLDSLTEEQIVLQSLDGFSHALESLASKMSHPFSDDLALRAVQIFFNSLREIKSGKSLREEVSGFQRASILAGLAQSSVGVGLVHALAHVLGPAAVISHAEVVSMFLLDVLELNLSHTDAYQKIDTLSGVSFGDLVDNIRFSHQKAGPKRLTLPNGVAVEEVAEKVRRDINIFTNPYLPTTQEITNIIRKHL